MLLKKIVEISLTGNFNMQYFGLGNILDFRLEEMFMKYHIEPFQVYLLLSYP